MKELKTFNVHDREVKTIKINFFVILKNFILSIPFFLVNLVFVSYILILNKYVVVSRVDYFNTIRNGK